jgi:hypothetical protein
MQTNEEQTEENIISQPAYRFSVCSFPELELINALFFLCSSIDCVG